MSIVSGPDDNSPKMTATCKDCNAVFETGITSKAFATIHAGSYNFECPACHKQQSYKRDELIPNS